MTRIGACAVCRARGRITPVAVDEFSRIPIGPAGLYACPDHRETLDVGVRVVSSAAKAGVNAYLERRAPGVIESGKKFLGAMGAFVRTFR